MYTNRSIFVKSFHNNILFIQKWSLRCTNAEQWDVFHAFYPSLIYSIISKCFVKLQTQI